MSADYTITITSLSGGLFAPNTTLDGKATLQATGNALIKYTGTHISNGTYKFTNVDDGKYKLFEDVACTSEITRWGGTNGKWIGDDAMEYYATSGSVASLQSATASLQTQVSACPTLTGSNTFTGTNVFSANTSIGNVSSTELGYLDSASSNLQAQIDNRLRLDLGQTVAGANTFTARNTFTAGVTLSGSSDNNIYNATNFQSTCPVVSVDCFKPNELARKLYIDNAIASIS